MSTQSAENYLDELLNSVNNDKKQARSLEELLAAEIKGYQSDEQVKIEDIPTPEVTTNVSRGSARTEADFMLEFEQELDGIDYDDFLRDFEDNHITPEDRLSDEDMFDMEEEPLFSVLGEVDEERELSDMEIDAQMVSDEVFDRFTAGLPEEHEEPDDLPEEDTFSLEELALEGMNVDDIFGAQDGGLESLPDSLPESDFTENAFQEPELIDLSEMGEEDLISLLAGTDNLSDLGDLFSQNDKNLPVDSVDPFASFAENEMAEQEAEMDIIRQEVKPEKKPNFLQKLSNLLFGKEEEKTKTESVTLASDNLPSAVELSEENADILAAFAVADKPQGADKDGKKNKKEKKEKKPKAPKAPKKPRAAKPKKEKKPKEKDNTPPLPKGPVAMVALLAISIFVLVFFGSELIFYSSAISEAEKLYNKGQYAEAAVAIAGVAVKEEDMTLKGQIDTLAAVDGQIGEYEIFILNEKKAEALNALISAAGRCDLAKDNAGFFGCANELVVLKNSITAKLEAEFDMSYKDALALYKLNGKDRKEYTRELYKVYEKLGILPE